MWPLAPADSTTPGDRIDLGPSAAELRVGSEYLFSRLA